MSDQSESLLKLNLSPTEQGWSLRLEADMPNGPSITAEGESLVETLVLLAIYIRQSSEWASGDICGWSHKTSSVVYGHNDGLSNVAAEAMLRVVEGVPFTGPETIEGMQRKLISELQWNMRELVKAVQSLEGVSLPRSKETGLPNLSFIDVNLKP